MRRIYMAVATIAALLVTAASSAAQTISVYDTNGPRLGGSVLLMRALRGGSR